MVESPHETDEHEGRAAGGLDGLRAEVESLARRVEALESRSAGATATAGTKPAGTVAATDPAPDASPGRS